MWWAITTKCMPTSSSKVQTVQMLSQKVTFIEFKDGEQLATHLASRIQQILQRAVEGQGQAGLVVSGGTTPIRFFRQLSRRDLPWEHITIIPADERWVAPHHPDSNENLIRSHLLQHKASAARFIGLKNSARTAAEGVAECERRLAAFPAPPEATVLGMGLDGHTASLFPHSHGLEAALDLDSGSTCAAICPTTAPHDRITLTLPFLLSSRHLFLHLEGKDKRRVYTKALADGDSSSMPVRLILSRADKPVTVYWAPAETDSDPR